MAASCEGERSETEPAVWYELVGLPVGLSRIHFMTCDFTSRRGQKQRGAQAENRIEMNVPCLDGVVAPTVESAEGAAMIVIY